MLRIKPVDAESSTWELGVSDHTLVVLAALLLDDECDESLSSLAEAMTLDPAFTIWAATIVTRQGVAFCTIRELAAQILPQLDDLLRINETEVSHLACEVPDETVSQDRPLRAILCAETARFLLTSEPPSSCDDPVYLGTILASAAEIVGCEPDEAAFLTVDLSEPEKAAIEEADRLIDRTQLPKKIGDLDERLLGVDAAIGPRWISQRRQHLEQAMPEAERLLKNLLVRLDRVRQIEGEFQKTLDIEKLEAMAEFAAGAGHEINNPIAVIAGRAQLMLQDETNPERARSLALINAQAKRVYEMIADMRLFARPPEPTFERINLVSLIDELLDELAETAEANSMTLRRLGVRRAIELDADPTQLTIMLRVMIQNSMEAIGSGGTIEIEPIEDEKGSRTLLPERPEGCFAQKGPGTFFVTIRISDDGPGITDEVRRHLFDPYYSGRQAGRGLGLGLSKVWRIVVTNHGGTIDVVSQPGQGTTFTICLPASHERAGR